ncbi:serine hydrolase [Brevibacillus reuszeri]|uniref:Serine hydrolase n=2 Tax=Brevibacillus reuszeri TaxID=54915 RepID=A0ABQ0TST8_9BACL|nr:serine hydrolase domain-containing protein [Brevibacillus reuszeri]MED1861420.1 serine hydrolase [Brevibacillus reuszeri]GED69963.1 serine hydrolase [Brevibacillus reuszeri]
MDMKTLGWTESFEEYMKKITEDAKVPGTSVGLAKEGELVYHQGFGYRDVETKAGITLDTVFGIGSITKSFTCVAIMQLQEAGKLSVHDPIVKYIPEFRLKGGKSVENITIHHFMTHSSGVPALPSLGYAMKRSMLDDPAAGEVEYDIYNHASIDTYTDLLDYIASFDFELLGLPGTELAYNNDAYGLLGLVIERGSGLPYEQYVKKHILEPAGMKHSVFLVEELGDYANLATCYANRVADGAHEVYAAPIWWDAPAMRAAGFLKASVRDMLSYTEIFRNDGLVGKERILSAKSVEQMISPHVKLGSNQYYGYGLIIHPNYHGIRLIEHSGGIKGVAAQMLIMKETGITATILNNTMSAPIGTMMSGLVCSLQSLPVDTLAYTYPQYDIDEGRFPEYVGKYKAHAGIGMTVEVEEGNLVLTMNKAKIPLRSVEEDGFALNVAGNENVVRFTRDFQGNVIRMSLGGMVPLIKEKAR